MDPCPGVETSPVLVHGAGAVGATAFGTAFFFQQVPFAEAKGWTHLELVATFPFYTVFAIVTTLGAGWMQDRFGTPKLIPLYQIPAIAAFAIFGLSVDPWHVILGLFFMGMTSGAVATWQNGFGPNFMARNIWRAQGDGGGHYGAGIGDWSWINGFVFGFRYWTVHPIPVGCSLFWGFNQHYDDWCAQVSGRGA